MPTLTIDPNQQLNKNNIKFVRVTCYVILHTILVCCLGLFFESGALFMVLLRFCGTFFFWLALFLLYLHLLELRSIRIKNSDKFSKKSLPAAKKKTVRIFNHNSMRTAAVCIPPPDFFVNFFTCSYVWLAERELLLRSYKYPKENMVLLYEL